MIAITKQQLPTIEELMELLQKRLETLSKVEELETRALEAVALVVSAYRQVELGADFYEGFVNKMLSLFPAEIHREYDELDAEKTTISLEAGERIGDLQDRIVELETDIDGLMAVNKELATDRDNLLVRIAETQAREIKMREAEVEPLVKRCDDLDKELDKTSADLRKAQAEIELMEKHSGVRDLQEKIRDTEVRLGAKIKELEQETEKWKYQAEQSKKEIAALKKQIEEKDILIFSAQATATAMQDKLQDSRYSDEAEGVENQKFKVGDRVIWFGSEGEIVGTREIRGKIEFSIKTEKGTGYANTGDLEIWTQQASAKNSTNEEAPKQESTELKFITPGIAYLKLVANDQVVSGYIAVKNGTDANGERLSQAKRRAYEWMDHIRGLYGVSSHAIEVRSAKRLKGFDYEIKISQKNHKGSILSILNSLSRCNFSVSPAHDDRREETEQASKLEEIEFVEAPQFDAAYPQYKVLTATYQRGSVYLSAMKEWKITGQEGSFDTKEAAAEELVRRSTSVSSNLGAWDEETAEEISRDDAEF